MTTAMVPAAAVVGGVVQVAVRSVEAVATMWSASEQTEQCRLQAAVATREIERRERAHHEEHQTRRQGMTQAWQLARDGKVAGADALHVIMTIAMKEDAR